MRRRSIFIVSRTANPEFKIKRLPIAPGAAKLRGSLEITKQKSSRADAFCLRQRVRRFNRVEMSLVSTLVQRLPQQSQSIVRTCVYGLGGGVAAVAFLLAMNWVYRLGLAALSHRSSGTFVLGSFLVIVVSSLVSGWLLSAFCPEAAGSGIPQLKLAFWKDFGAVPMRVAWVKFLAGIISVGGGASMGREGPSVQLAGVVASNLAGLTERQTRAAARLRRRAAWRWVPGGGIHTPLAEPHLCWRRSLAT